jgi:hypothetical protein
VIGWRRPASVTAGAKRVGAQAGRRAGVDGELLAEHAGVVAGRQAEVAADDDQGAAVLDVVGDVGEVAGDLMIDGVEVVEDDEVEGAELLLEELVGREGDQAELGGRVLAVGVVDPAQDVVAEQLDVGVAAEESAKRPDVPVGATGDVQHADLVAQDLDDEGAAVVGERGLAPQRADGDLVDELADAVGRDLEADRDRGAVVREGDAGGRDDRAVAPQVDVDLGSGVTVGDQLGAELRDVLDEGELAGVQLGDRDVADRRGAGADGGHRDAERPGGEQQRVLSFRTCPRKQAIGQHDDGGERARVGGGGVRGGEIGEGVGEVRGGAGGRHREGLGGSVVERLAARGEGARRDRQALLAPGGARGGGGGPEVAQAIDAGRRRRAGLVGVGQGHAGAAVDEDRDARAGRAHGLLAQAELEADDQQGEHAEHAQGEQAQAQVPGHRAGAAIREHGLGDRQHDAQTEQSEGQGAGHVACDDAPALHQSVDLARGTCPGRQMRCGMIEIISRLSAWAQRQRRLRRRVSTWARSAL